MRVKHALKVLGKIFAASAALLAIFLITVVLMPPYTNPVQIDFTRHLSRYDQGARDSLIAQDSFFGVPGSARLIVTGAGEAVSATIQLNGIEVAAPDNFDGTSPFEVPVELVKDNTITVALNGAPESSVSVRVKQLADLELHVQSRLHFNNNVRNFEASRAFYGKLGFETLSEFPDTNTQAMAKAIGIKTPTSYDGSTGDHAGGYLLHGELIALGSFGGGVIDLIEFTIPRNEEPPYAQVNHLGMAKAAMLTTNIAAGYDYMKGIGAAFIAPPTTRSDGTRFAIFTDPDGTFYELSEIDGEDASTETTHITSLGHLNINVSDFERSRAWYQMMGYEVSRKLAPTDSLDVANAMGLNEAFEIDGAILTHQSDGSTLELVQWITPYNPQRAYAIPVNHLGMHRTAFFSADIEADVAALRSQGVDFLSPITPCCSGLDSRGSIVAFYDPDGTIVELADAPFMGKILMVLKWFAD